MVKIHGNWCGPNWTDGKNQPASAAGVDFNGPCVSKLDCACRAHDKDCSDPRGCSSKGDNKLVSVALKEAVNPINRIFNPEYANVAAFVAAGIKAASLTRRR